jgi:phosphoribosyl-AMP cyclohydrolase
MELSARIGINGLLIAVSVSTLGQLVPYIYSRAEQLQVLEEAVANAEASTTQLKADFGRYFDPWQTENLMQEQSGYKSSTERQIVWTEPKWD